MKKTNLIPVALLALFSTLNSQLSTVFAQGTAFSYEGRLNDGANPANGKYDVTFTLFNASSGPSQVGSTITDTGIGVTNGLFTVVLDFSANFPGADRWLEIAVRTNGAASFATLTPRQKILPVPYAIFSETIATNTIATANLQNGAVSGAKLAVPLSLSGSTATGGIVSGNNAGSGTGVSGSSSGGRGVFGQAASNDPGVAGVWGENSAFNGTGVVGKSTATTGAGVYGESAGSGTGVAGSSSTGYGVSGSSSASYGVYGSSSTFDGVVGRSTGGDGVSGSSTGGRGVSGRAASNGASVAGVWGENSALNGTAVAGKSTATTGTGVYGESAGSGTGVAGSSSTGYGVSGSSSASYGVYGNSSAFDGVHGASTAGDGVSGASNDGNGVYGHSNKGDSSHGGVYGVNSAVGGTGVVGKADNINSAGVAGVADTAGSTGVYGRGTKWGGYFDGPVSVCSLQIRGGCDLAEPFEMSNQEISKGSVVVIDDKNAGQLKLSDRAYDTRVAGIVSGANGVNPGISLRQEGTLEGGQNVALSGRVYVLADASGGAIKPGDLLTTSNTPGHAMKVINPTKAQGAMIGKALSSLSGGKGMVLVLVTLQ